MKIRFAAGGRKYRSFAPFIRRCLTELLGDRALTVSVSFVTFANPKQSGRVLLAQSTRKVIDLQLNAAGSPYSWAKVLAHEVIHIEQIVSGRLKLVAHEVIEFDGVQYALANHQTDWIDTQSPWEREAYAAQADRFTSLTDRLSGVEFDMGGLTFTL